MDDDRHRDRRTVRIALAIGMASAGLGGTALTLTVARAGNMLAIAETR
jgi:hypothetical protein